MGFAIEMTVEKFAKIKSVKPFTVNTFYKFDKPLWLDYFKRDSFAMPKLLLIQLFNA
ncbi:MAG: hypothetical protein RBR74_13640 [Ignavibacteriaceae bacterium]|jgi:hypothetical protein|nr:hypothetical protein [Ignavibacteriaceae bacterium]